MSVESSLQKLATYRLKNTRKSQEVYEEGILILKSRTITKLGDEQWAFLEQLALAAIDVGKLDVADQCIQQLSNKFPKSPRVDVLTGIRMEASESTTTVFGYYDELLKEDPTHVAAWKRRISVLRRIGQMNKAVEELNELLDIFYLDTEGWLELADIYSSSNQYNYALQALSQVLLLAPQNPFTFLQFAETAYTSGDVPLALRMFLLVVEMCDAQDPQPTPKGISIRAWWGVKLCTRLLSSSISHSSPSKTPIPDNLNLIDELATERVLIAYSGEKGAQTRALVSKWMSGS